MFYAHHVWSSHPASAHQLPCHTQLLLLVSPSGGMSCRQLVPTVNYYIWDCGAWRQPAACGVGWREPVQPWQLSKVTQTDKHSLFLCMIHHLFCGSCLERLVVTVILSTNIYFINYWNYISILFTSFECLCVFFYIYFKSNRKNPIFYFQIRIQHSVIVWSPVGKLIGMQIISYWAKVASPKCYKILYLTPISIVIICLTRYYSNLRPPSAPHGNILGV